MNEQLPPDLLLEEARSWTKTVLAENGLTPDGRFEPVAIRPWSAVFRAGTSDGQFYFKAVSPHFAFEPRLTAALAAWLPDCIAPVLAVDLQRRWMLAADGGQTLRQAFGGGLSLDVWSGVLTQYAALQIELARYVTDMSAFGVRDRRLKVLPALYESLLQDKELLLIDQEEGLNSFEHEQLLRAAPIVRRLCAQLGSYALPASLHHNDLHDANVFYNNGRTRFFDWGDSSIAHPFFSLRTVFVSIEHQFGLAENDIRFDDLARAYLQPWSAFEAEANLWAAYGLARRLWMLSSAVKYQTQLNAVPGMREEYAGAVPSLLRAFLHRNENLI